MARTKQTKTADRIMKKFIVAAILAAASVAAHADAMNVCSGLGGVVGRAVQKRDSGVSEADVKSWVHATLNIPNNRHVLATIDETPSGMEGNIDTVVHSIYHDPKGKNMKPTDWANMFIIVCTNQNAGE